MTAVIFKFQQPSGDPVVGAPFTVTLRKPTFDEMNENGILLPGAIEGVTDAQGECTLELAPGYGTYYLSMVVPGEQETPEGCIGGLRYKFIVPESPTPVRVEDLIVTVPTWSRPWDEQALLIITEAKVASQAAAIASEASAVRAEAAAVDTEGDAVRAEAARDAAISSQNAAAGSAQAASSSAVSAGQSAADALASKNAAANSANAANNSAVSASGDAGRAAASATAANASKDAAAASATAASGSATTATNAANSATASKDAAATSATTASTKAGEAATSAGNALTQANRAKTEADRATAATDGKQDKNGNLTALSALTGAADRMFYFTSGSAMAAAPLTTKARSLLARADTAGMQAELGLVPVISPNDVTLGRVVTPGWMGLGTTNGNVLPSANAQVALPAGEYYTNSSWAGSPFPGVDGRNQGYLTVSAWSDSNYMAQHWRPLSRNSAANMHRFAYGGVWQAWEIICSGHETQDTNSMAQRLQMRNVLGIGTPHTYCIDIDARSAPSLVLGLSYVTNATIGAKPGGYVYGVVNTVINASDHMQQDFVGLNAVPGVTQRAYRRSGYNTAWGPWRLVIDTDSATNNVDDGGLMSYNIVNGVVRHRFASGLQIINGTFGSTPAIPANGYNSIVDLTIPFNTGPDVSYTTALVVASPYVTNDWYGVTNSYMTTPTNLRMLIRNGAAGEQAFGVRGIIVGYWK